MKKLVRIKKNGIVWKRRAFGFGEYFSIDPVILRVAYMFFFFDWFRWLLIAGYVVC